MKRPPLQVPTATCPGSRIDAASGRQSVASLRRSARLGQTGRRSRSAPRRYSSTVWSRSPTVGVGTRVSPSASESLDRSRSIAVDLVGRRARAARAGDRWRRSAGTRAGRRRSRSTGTPSASVSTRLGTSCCSSPERGQAELVELASVSNAPRADDPLDLARGSGAPPRWEVRSVSSVSIASSRRSRDVGQRRRVLARTARRRAAAREQRRATAASGGEQRARYARPAVRRASSISDAHAEARRAVAHVRAARGPTRCRRCPCAPTACRPRTP